MFNLLIIDDNLEYSKNLINYILKNNSNIRLSCIASNGLEALDYLYSPSYNFDIILLDLKLPLFSGLDILKKLNEKPILKYYNSIIIISNEIKLLSNLFNNNYLYSYTNKINGFDNILSILNNLINNKISFSKSLDEKILKELNYLKYSDKCIGTKYLFEAISLILNNPSLNYENLSENVYPLIANKYNKSINNIKCNINNATVLMNCDCKKEIITNYFQFTNTSSEAKPKQVINAILNKLKEYH